MTVPMLMPNSPAAYVSLEFGARAGAHAPVSACASGAEAIGYGVEMIRSGRADVVIAGGTEAAIHPHAARRVRRDRRRCPPATTTRRAPRARTTSPATGSSSARAPASSCSRAPSTPRARGATGLRPASPGRA